MSSSQGEPVGGRELSVLSVTAGPAAGTHLSFSGEFRLGRAELGGGDLGGDPALSRHHAVLRVPPSGLSTIEDVGSANGTFVNGERVTGIQPVKAGDVLEVGDSSLRLVAGFAHAPAVRSDTETRARSSVGARRSVPEVGPEETGWAPSGAAVRSQTRDHPVPPRVPEVPGRWVGTASGVSYRSFQRGRGQKSAQNQALTFRLEQFSGGGDRERVLTVELKGRELSGDVSDGDHVEARGRMRRGVLRAKTVHNLTTGATVRAVGVFRYRVMGGAGAVLKLAFFLVWLAIVVFIALLIVHHGHP